MADDHGHDGHSSDTHSKQCDEEGCEFVAKTHAHDDDQAAEALAHQLAEHNKEVHDKDTSAEDIKDDVKEKMTSHGHDEN